MAEEVPRWTVTYTKHVKQKRKVYHDGYLLLLSNKIMLYDDSDNLLDSNFLKGDENLSSGETLTVGSYLVDIGESDNPGFKQEEKSKGRSASDGNSTPWGRKVSAVKISPSQRIIREFKKNEKLKYGLHERSPSSTSSTAGEWQALYTTHLTQKAKKYHDGFIQLVLCGSQGRQAKLYDVSKTLLSSRFLKKDEMICPGESLKFDGYLVDIGEPENGEDSVDVKAEGQNCNAFAKHTVERYQSRPNASTDDRISSLKNRKIPQSRHTTVTKGHSQHDTSLGKDVETKSCGIGADKAGSTKSIAPNMPLRRAHDILSFLKKPIAPGSTFVAEQVPVKQCGPSPVLFNLDTKNEDQFDGRVHQDLKQLKKHGLENKDKVNQYDGLDQKNSNLDEEGTESRIDLVNFSHEIKIEKDCEGDIGIQLRSSPAVVFSSSREKPTPLPQGPHTAATTNNICNSQPMIGATVDRILPPVVDLEDSSQQDLTFSEGNVFPTRTRLGDLHQHCTTNSQADHRGSEAQTHYAVETSEPASYSCAEIGLVVKENPVEIRRSTEMNDCPSFDLCF